jgi:hypothetical protein
MEACENVQLGLKDKEGLRRQDKVCFTVCFSNYI